MTKSTRSLCWFLFAFAFLALGSCAQAADAATGLTSTNIVTWLTPVIVPIVIAAFKKFAPSIPSWILPIAAPVLGVLIDVINSYATAQSSNLIVAALLGLAGVGVREVKDQLTPAKTDQPPTP